MSSRRGAVKPRGARLRRDGAPVSCQWALASHGFTLVELLVTIAVLAILVSLSAPSFTAMIRNNRLTAVSNEITGSLNFARSEAIKRAANVTVCKTVDASVVNPVCATSGEWSGGWMVFVDKGVAGVFDGTDVRLQVAQPDSGSAHVTGDVNFANYVVYNSRGAAANGAGGNLSICLEGLKRDIAVNGAGRLKIAAGTC
jgi:type IV fimbrial biogenesis protein FimT